MSISGDFIVGTMILSTYISLLNSASYRPAPPPLPERKDGDDVRLQPADEPVVPMPPVAAKAAKRSAKGILAELYASQDASEALVCVR